ncbi:Dipeptide permease D [Roseimaritima multifibrata]|uniref:Dipeptide permease D n=1 Tax=Roseimaritima multifibrata TaxID=1930274 RepID=A0A517MCI9_9BACT|nr:peptide MFS transporter [Roseimaritima multifibrata]QDS92591.1 Dipeptide permease D [Roseimaritima multifibrata]
MSTDASLPTPNESASDSATLFGHPVGLFTLFFVEMWERFSYYGMRALLVLYMIKGFLKYGDAQAYTVYGAYTALVYMTPFIGGLLADRLLGQRRAVIIGGILMAMGHLLMTIESPWPFFFALALLITGNGFFKPNISTTVGALYPAGSKKRDGGFTIFYMGINLGAAMSPLLCGYLGETYGWHWGFGVATIGMMVGLAVFVMPNLISQLLVGGGAIVTAGSLIFFTPDNPLAIAVNIFVAVGLLIAGIIACFALGRGGLPSHVGNPPEGALTPNRMWGLGVGIVIAIPVFALLVSGLSPFTESGQSYQLISSETVEKIASYGPLGYTASILAGEVSKPAGLVLTVIGLLSFGYLLRETFRLGTIGRHRMIVALILIFFQMLFFAFFEQAGSSISNFTDRNVDRIANGQVVTSDMLGKTIDLQPTQEQLGLTHGDSAFTMTDLNKLREENKDPNFTIAWTITEEHIEQEMAIAGRNSELATSSFQALNAIFILLFGLPFAYLWSKLGERNADPSSPVKFALGLIQLGLGFGALWMGAINADSRGMVSISWLVLGYLLHTTGELCLSPVGLSTMTKLSPKHLVSTVMGGWFLATAFSQYLAGIISQFTGVTNEGGDESGIPIPLTSVMIYGDVFYKIAIAAVISGIACLVLSPWLKAWMHQDVIDSDE